MRVYEKELDHDAEWALREESIHFTSGLNPYVQQKYLELWTAAQQKIHHNE
jgi:hypothetical protein